MRVFDYFLVADLGVVIGQATLIITVNTMRGFWGTTNKIHVLIVTFYPIYLGSVIYASLECNRLEEYCSTLWKICSMLYIIVTMAVYLFYYAKSKVLYTLTWDGKCHFERLAILMILMMGAGGLGFFLLSIWGVHHKAFLMEEECHLAERPWIPIFWMIGDAVLSILLLLLFLRPLKEIKQMLNDWSRSVDMLNNVHRVIQKHRNLLIITVVVTLGVMVTIAVKDLCMRTIHYLCAVDRLVALQCITLTFSYEAQEYFYYRRCLFVCCRRKPEVDEELSSSSEMPTGRRLKSPSIIVMSPAVKQPHRDSESVCFELKIQHG